MTVLFRTIAASAVVIAVNASPASAAIIPVTASDSGAYFSTGAHNPGIENYLTGRFGTEHRSFFVFDLTGVSEEITAATLNLYNPGLPPCCLGYVSPDTTETFAVVDVSTPVATVVAGGAGLVSIFDDLGTGTSFGEVVASAADNDTTLSMSLNAAAITALNAARGGPIALGGVLTTLGGTSADEYVFGFSTASFIPIDIRRLDLTVDGTAIPEPAMLALLAVVLTGVGWVATRKPANR